MVLIIAALTLIVFMIRTFPRIKRKFAFGSDTFFHLYYAGLFRENKFIIPKKSPKVIINHEISYPYLYHFLLGMFSEKKRLGVEKYLSPLFDTLSSVVFTVGVLILCNFQSSAEIILLFVVMLFSFSPALLKFEGTPRAFQGSPRVFGQFLYISHVVSFMIYDATDSLWALVLAIVFGGLVWVSAKFAVQVLVFSGVIFTLFFASYALVFTGAFVFAILFSKGKIFKLIRGHVNHSITLLKKLDIAPKRNGFKVFRNHIAEILKALFRFQFKKAYNIFFEENFPPFTFLIYFPFFLVVFNPSLWNGDNYFCVWTFSGLVLYLLTSFKGLSFLGENTRYLEFSLLPAMYLSVSFLIEHELYWIIFIYMVFSVVAAVYYVNNFIVKFKDADKLHTNRLALFDYLNHQEKGNLFAMCSTGHPALLLSNFPVLSLLVAPLEMRILKEEDFDLLGKNFPYPSGNLDNIIERYNVRYISLTDSEEKIYLNRYINSKDYFNENLKLLKQSGNLKVYQVVR
tara:strand:+ start:2274 stop:3812 length:1539 start_codon:yes stop_codon:yes gene_type:complete